MCCGAGRGLSFCPPATPGTHARRHFFKYICGGGKQPAVAESVGAGCGTAPARSLGASIARLCLEVVRHSHHSCSRGAPDSPRTLSCGNATVRYPTKKESQSKAAGSHTHRRGRHRTIWWWAVWAVFFWVGARTPAARLPPESRLTPAAWKSPGQVGRRRARAEGGWAGVKMDDDTMQDDEFVQPRSNVVLVPRRLLVCCSRILLCSACWQLVWCC
jgi:hypothetical protein